MSASPRQVHLFSMDSDHFYAAPTTTAGLQAYYQKYGRHPENTSFQLHHFRDASAAGAFIDEGHRSGLGNHRHNHLVFGLSVYTWNAAEFLSLAKCLKQHYPAALIVAGGPHVQQAEDYLGIEAIDIVILGEGEATFQELLDADGPEQWPDIPGLAWWTGEGIATSAERKRQVALDELPSALDVLPLTDEQGNALYDAISYETSRGCPFRCAFCEWGTGAIGTKMIQFSMQRVERDWRKITAAGIKDIWLADSNFGALKEDLAKASLICELKKETGYPRSFATSWSKKHSPKVQEIVLLLNRNGLLPHYQLALQTLTPEALELSNRKNMSSNQYEPIAQAMAEQGVPIAAELIWGLPGDRLGSFEGHLDHLLATFPNINIFGYTLLPGTEFYEKRDQYRIETVPVAGYGKAKGEYVIACHSFDRQEGLEGYRMIVAHMIFAHGAIIPMTVRWLALKGFEGISALLRRSLTQVIEQLNLLPANDRQIGQHTATEYPTQGIEVYEQRADIYLSMLAAPARVYKELKRELTSALLAANHADWLDELSCVLALDAALIPQYGERRRFVKVFDFDAQRLLAELESMRTCTDIAFGEAHTLWIETPGGAGEMLRDPDGGSWMKANFTPATELIESVSA